MCGVWKGLGPVGVAHGLSAQSHGKWEVTGPEVQHNAEPQKTDAERTLACLGLFWGHRFCWGSVVLSMLQLVNEFSVVNPHASPFDVGNLPPHGFNNSCTASSSSPLNPNPLIPQPKNQISRS